jgi:hypothetical protein
MGSVIKVAVLVVGGICAAKWLSQEEYGQKRYERIMHQYIDKQVGGIMR